MTTQKSFKRFVRSRMEKTGESYTAARAVLLAVEPSADTPEVPFVASDETIRRRTGRGWEEWFDLLDTFGAAERTHREISRWVADQLGIEPLVWEAQAVTTSYERARGRRVEGQRADGYFAINVSRTVQVPAPQLFDAITDATRRRQWLPDTDLGERTATRPKSARFDGAHGSRIYVVIDAVAPGKSRVSLEHTRLVDGDDAEKKKAFWRERLTALKAHLEAGDLDG